MSAYVCVYTLLFIFFQWLCTTRQQLHLALTAKTFIEFLMVTSGAFEVYLQHSAWWNFASSFCSDSGSAFCKCYAKIKNEQAFHEQNIFYNVFLRILFILSILRPMTEIKKKINLYSHYYSLKHLIFTVKELLLLLFCLFILEKHVSLNYWLIIKLSLTEQYNSRLQCVILLILFITTYAYALINNFRPVRLRIFKHNIKEKKKNKVNAVAFLLKFNSFASNCRWKKINKRKIF